MDPLCFALPPPPSLRAIFLRAILGARSIFLHSTVLYNNIYL